MAIHKSGTFEYEADFPEEGFNAFDIILHGEDRSGGNEARLVGHKPMIRFWDNRLILVANDSDRQNSSVRVVSIHFGDAIGFVAQPGDRLYIVRTNRGGIGLSLLHNGKLTLAIGAITCIPLGDLLAESSARGEMEFGLHGERLMVRERDAAIAGDYYIYVERCWQDGLPGIDECVSVCLADNMNMRLASMRSAILLGRGDMRFVNWDGDWLYE
jgi:hypothetical protein